MDLIQSMQKDSSALVLILSNLITIILAVIFSWSIMIILWSYWLQSVIIGFFNFFKILSLKNYSAERVKLGAAVFFAFHYGFFHLAYALFLAGFSFFSQSISFGDLTFVLLSGIIFFFNHLFSFLYFKNKSNKKNQNIGSVMMFPYLRIIPMHFIIVFGGIFLVTGIGSVFVLILFLLLKTAADLAMHLIEHKEQLS